MLELNLATDNDLIIIANLAKDIWNEHYVPIIGQEQVNYMLDKMYNHPSLLEQKIQKKHQFYLVNYNSQNIGFISVSSENNADYFIHKFYIKQSLSNKGIGSRILEKMTTLVSPKSFSLTVNRQNFKSINFYFKNGFKIDYVADFEIGNGYQMNDFVMKKVFS